MRGRRIAVTGATGFLGRYIVDALLARGAQVVGVVRDRLRPPDGWARVLWRIRTHHRPPDWIRGRVTVLRAQLP